MILYAILLEKAGFILSNLLFLFLIFRFVWKKGWPFVFTVTFILDLGFYVTFEVIMRIPLPEGILTRFL